MSIELRKWPNRGDELVIKWPDRHRTETTNLKEPRSPGDRHHHHRLGVLCRTAGPDESDFSVASAVAFGIVVVTAHVHCRIGELYVCDLAAASRA